MGTDFMKPSGPRKGKCIAAKSVVRDRKLSGTSSVVTFWSQLKVNLSHLPKSIKTSQFHSLAKQMQAHKDPPIFAHTRIQRHNFFWSCSSSSAGSQQSYGSYNCTFCTENNSLTRVPYFSTQRNFSEHNWCLSYAPTA